MDPNLSEWLNLVVRWVHVITGIAWIGTSFFFNWLDSHLTPPERPEKGVDGELWLVHSGGFYQVVKKQLGPHELPRVLHWFKCRRYNPRRRRSRRRPLRLPLTSLGGEARGREGVRGQGARREGD